MQFTTLLSAATIAVTSVSANEVVTTDGKTITYIDVTTTPEVTVSVVSTVLSTSTPYVTTTLSASTTEAASTEATSTEVTSTSTTSSKESNTKKGKVATVTSTDLKVSQQTTTITSCPSSTVGGSTQLPQVDAFSAAGAILNHNNNGMIGLGAVIMMAGLSLL